MTETPERPEPCPFCGSTEIIQRQVYDEDDWIVSCRSKLSECPMEIVVKDCYSAEQALEAWNRRASSLGEPVSQEAPYDWEGSYTMLRDALDANLGEFIRDGEEAEEYLYVQGIERAASVISSASPLAEHERAVVERRRNAAEHSDDAVMELVAIIDRLSASAPSPEDKRSKQPRLDEPCAKHPEYLNRDCPHSHIWPNGAPT